MKTENIKSMPIAELVERLEQSAQNIPEHRDCSGLKFGEVCRQGDVYIQMMDPKDVELLYQVESRQLVPGTTNGSRHVVQDSPHTKIWKSNPSLKFRLPNAPGKEWAAGPAVVSSTGWCLMHPTHPFCDNFPKGVAQVWYQIDARTQQRAKD